MHPWRKKDYFLVPVCSQSSLRKQDTTVSELSSLGFYISRSSSCSPQVIFQSLGHRIHFLVITSTVLESGEVSNSETVYCEGRAALLLGTSAQQS